MQNRAVSDTDLETKCVRPWRNLFSTSCILIIELSVFHNVQLVTP
jgi:hypothetical protein